MTAPVTDPATPPVTDPAAPPVVETPPAQPPVVPSGDDKPWSDPVKAEAEILRLRRENASERTTAKANAAQAARDELAQEVGQALGLVKDDEKVDPATLATELTTSRTESKDLRVENAVLRLGMAPEATFDSGALLDSVTFRAKVAALDPTDTAAITAAIGEVVAANPHLTRSQAGPARMQPNRAQGSSAQPPLGINERIAAAQEAGDTRLALRLKSAQAIQNSKP